eukprot:m.170029 g.170029  ORF g.170029 m.170029 type:complete len:319 (+) comp16678_c0_seq4:755-1711(+)
MMAVAKRSLLLLLVLHMASASWKEFNLVEPAIDMVQTPCRRLLDAYNQAELSKPAPSLTASQQAAFTLNGSIAFEEFFVDDSLNGQGTHYRYTRKQLTALIKQSTEALTKARSLTTPPTWAGNPNRMPQHVKDNWFAYAITQQDFQGARVAIFGSSEPWLEALAIAAGAAAVTTVEYNKVTYDHPAITTIQPSNFFTTVKEPFDYLLSASSFDHDGLGRYGDPLQPMGDLKAMRLCRCVLKPGGKLLVSFPVGPDAVVYNLHRRYGSVRLPHMLYGWDVESIVGWDEARLSMPVDVRHTFEPVFVLTRPSKQSSHREL